MRYILYPIPSYLKVLRSVNPGDNPYNNCLFRAIPSNIDLRQVFDVRQYFPVLLSETVIIGLQFTNIARPRPVRVRCVHECQ